MVSEPALLTQLIELIKQVSEQTSDAQILAVLVISV